MTHLGESIDFAIIERTSIPYIFKYNDVHLTVKDKNLPHKVELVCSANHGNILDCKIEQTKVGSGILLTYESTKEKLDFTAIIEQNETISYKVNDEILFRSRYFLEKLKIEYKNMDATTTEHQIVDH